MRYSRRGFEVLRELSSSYVPDLSVEHPTITRHHLCLIQRSRRAASRWNNCNDSSEAMGDMIAYTLSIGGVDVLLTTRLRTLFLQTKF